MYIPKFFCVLHNNNYWCLHTSENSSVMSAGEPIFLPLAIYITFYIPKCKDFSVNKTCYIPS